MKVWLARNWTFWYVPISMIMAWAIFSLALWVALPVISNAILYATAAPILIGAFKIKAWAEEVLRRDTWVKQQQRTPHL